MVLILRGSLLQGRWRGDRRTSSSHLLRCSRSSKAKCWYCACINLCVGEVSVWFRASTRCGGCSVTDRSSVVSKGMYKYGQTSAFLLRWSLSWGISVAKSCLKRQMQLASLIQDLCVCVLLSSLGAISTSAWKGRELTTEATKTQSWFSSQFSLCWELQVFCCCCKSLILVLL